MLSGLISACMISHFFINASARNIWDAYARTARRLIPTSLPNRLTTSRRFMLRHTVSRSVIVEREATHLRDSKTRHR